MWACERFSIYLFGRHFSLETDHMVLVSLLSNKHLNNLPPHNLRFCLRLATGITTVSHIFREVAVYSGHTFSYIYTLRDEMKGDLDKEEETFITAVTLTLPATEKRLNMYY